MASDSRRMLAISGSLRRDSYNTALLHAAEGLAPAGWIVDVYNGLGAIPPYDDDVRVAGFPDVVQNLRERARRATPSFSQRQNTIARSQACSRMPSTGCRDRPTNLLQAKRRW